MAIANYDQNMFAYRRDTQEVIELQNNFGSTYYNGNFKGAHNMPTIAASDRLYKPSGTTEYDATQYYDNDGTYLRFRIKGSGMTTSLVSGDVYLKFTGTDYMTIQQAVDLGHIDPIVFRYTSMSSTSYLWDTGSIFTGGRTNTKSYPYVDIHFKPISFLTHIRCYTSRTLNTTYDGIIFYKTDILTVGLSPDDVIPYEYVSSGEWHLPTFPINNVLKFKLRALVNIPENSSIITSFSIDGEGVWTDFQLNEYVEINKNSTSLDLKIVLTTLDSKVTPKLSGIKLELFGSDDERVLKCTFDRDNKFQNVVGPLTVSYDQSQGFLTGRGGAVETFEISFLPEDLVLVPNPYTAENISTIANSNVDFIKITYIDAYKTENINVGASAEIDFIYVGVVNP